MHAMAFGTPVVIHDRVEHHFPEWEAVVEAKTGFFYRFGDAVDLAAKIEGAIFPVPAKRSMSVPCQAMMRERYNPHRQVVTFVRAVREVARLRRRQVETVA